MPSSEKVCVKTLSIVGQKIVVMKKMESGMSIDKNHLAKSMTLEQLAEAQWLAREWKAKGR